MRSYHQQLGLIFPNDLIATRRNAMVFPSRIFITEIVDVSPIKKTYKIVLVGDPAVGKTSIRKRYFGEGFRHNYLMTLGTDFAVKHLDEMKSLQIWDLTGSKVYRKIRKKYFLGTHGVILVLDITREESIDNLSTWFKEIREMTKNNATTIIVGNKIDLRTAIKESLSEEEITLKLGQFEEEIGHSLYYYETSALTGENIDKIFDKLIEKIELKIARYDKKN